VTPVNLAVTMLVWFYFFPREAAGASRTRHSPRPQLFWARDSCITRASSRREIVGVCSCPSSAKRGEGGSLSAKRSVRRVGAFVGKSKHPHPTHRSLHSRCATLPTLRGGGIRKRDRGADRGSCVWSSLRGVMRHFSPSCPALCRASTSFVAHEGSTWMAGTSPGHDAGGDSSLNSLVPSLRA